MNREEFYTVIERFLSENKIGEMLIPRELVAELSERLAKLSLPPAEGAETNRQIQQLKEFHTAFKLPQREIPTIIPPDEFKLRHKILMEEVEELREAYNEGDIVEVADAITDCLYVLIGTALQFGIADKLEACFDEVHRSNMSKLGNDGKPIMREDGKVMKGENFKRPDLERVLNEPVAAQPHPTAEGAEEILDRYLRDYPWQHWGRENALKAMREFASITASKMVGDYVSKEEYDHAVNTIGELQEQIKDMKEDLRMSRYERD